MMPNEVRAATSGADTLNGYSRDNCAIFEAIFKKNYYTFCMAQKCAGVSV